MASSYFKHLKRSWIVIRPLRRVLFLFSFFVILITGIIIAIYPDWLKQDWVLYLLIPVAVSFLGVFVNLFQIFSSVNESIKLFERVHRTLKRVTDNSVRILKPKLKGIPRLITREETKIIFESIERKKSLLLTGDAGAGKSGIACSLVETSLSIGWFPVLIDTRQLSNAEHLHDLRSFFDLDESVFDAVARISEDIPVIIIADQLDSIAGSAAGRLVIDFLVNCLEIKNVFVLAISRYKEANEQGAIRPLFEAQFEMVICRPVNEDLIYKVFSNLGIAEVPQAILELADNLLDLDIICEIIRNTSLINIKSIYSRVDLWEKYRITLHDRENYSNDNGNDLILKAVQLAQEGLLAVNRGFNLEIPPSLIENRLISGNIITQVSGNKYQFRHDVLQDYLYSWYACERNLLPNHVRDEIGKLHERNVLIWMRDIYQERNSFQYEVFLEAALDG
ncbi:MAG: hypothetical protein U0V18_16775 [Anaerolineales bacterium]